jgi:hypothetical protein
MFENETNLSVHNDLKSGLKNTTIIHKFNEFSASVHYVKVSESGV